MSIQANINQTLSIAGFLFQQGAGKEITEKKALQQKMKEEADILTRSLTQYTEETAKSYAEAYKKYQEGGGKSDYKTWMNEELGEKESRDIWNKPNVAAARSVYQQDLARYSTSPEQRYQFELENRQLMDEAELYEETVTLTKDEKMADKAAIRLEEEQSRVRGEATIDHRKKKREQNRRRNEIRKERKKLGGMNNGE